MAIEVMERPGSGRRSRAARMTSSVATLGVRRPAAGASGGQALVGADDDEFADELREGGEDVEDEPAAGGGGVEVLMQRGEADATFAEVGDHVDEVLEAAAVAEVGLGRGFGPRPVSGRRRCWSTGSAILEACVPPA
ncbi:UNVERIFIED_ORG: hypothetical protein FHR35_002423 [Microbispora rosea subsp. rosea]